MPDDLTLDPQESLPVDNPEAPPEQPEVEAAGQEEQAPPERKHPSHIPWDRFQEIWEQKRRAEDEAHQARMMAMQLQQQMMAQRVPQPQEPAIDPEVESLIAPVVRKMVGPMAGELQRIQVENQRLVAERAAQQAEAYVRQAVPDLDELWTDLDAVYRNLPPKLQLKWNDPDYFVEVANRVRLERRTGNTTIQAAIKNDMRSRARSESGGQSQGTPNPKQPIDWRNMSNEEYDAITRKMGINF